jgi:hypothetical protein
MHYTGKKKLSNAQFRNIGVPSVTNGVHDNTVFNFRKKYF